MFENLFKNKVNAETTEFTITPCVYGGDSEHCDLIIQLRKCQDLRKEIKGQIEELNKGGHESLCYFMNFLCKLEDNGFKMTGFLNCCDSHYNISTLERTINECSAADLWRMTEELKTYRNKADIIYEKNRALRAVEDDITNIKLKLGIE